jgi:hypothetical protein
MAREKALIFLCYCFLLWWSLLLLLLLCERCYGDAVGLPVSLTPLSSHHSLVCHEAFAIVTWWLISVVCSNWITGVNQLFHPLTECVCIGHIIMYIFHYFHRNADLFLKPHFICNLHIYIYIYTQSASVFNIFTLSVFMYRKLLYYWILNTMDKSKKSENIQFNYLFFFVHCRCKPILQRLYQEQGHYPRF